MPRWFAAILFALAATPAFAADAVIFPISIPMECVPLAQREHQPVVIANRIEALREKVKLARMRDSDPLVSQCKQAVADLEAMSHEMERQANNPVAAR